MVDQQIKNDEKKVRWDMHWKWQNRRCVYCGVVFSGYVCSNCGRHS